MGNSPRLQRRKAEPASLTAWVTMYAKTEHLTRKGPTFELVEEHSDVFNASRMKSGRKFES